MKRKQDNAEEGWEAVKKGRAGGGASSSSSSSQGLDSSNSVLHKVLRGGGWSLSGQTHVIADPTQLRRHVNKTFTQSPEALKKAQEELAEIIDNDEELQHWLRPVLTSPDQTEHVATNDCVLKLLLSVDATQPFLIERLLEKLPQFIVEDTDYGSSLPRQILRQFRWLDSVVESEALTTKLMEVMKACPTYLKKEIITFIPDIIDDYGFPMIVNDLQELMEQESELTVPILDTLSNLNLPSELTDQVRNSVLRSLPSAALDDLPVVVSFLLRSTNKDNVQQVAKKIRCNLDFAPLLSNRQAKSSEAATKKMGETLTLEAIKSGIRSQQYILKAFLKEIQTVPSQAEHKLLDLWLLWVLHSIPAHKKATEAIFRKKIVAGHFTSALLSHSIAGHTQALAPYHASLLALQELFLRSPEPAIRQFGVAQYVLVFQHFTEKYQRQELLGNIITHIGSGAGEEIDAALSVLLKLIESKAMREQLASYSVYIQGILDYLHTLQDNQIRNIFTVFCQLVSRASHSNSPSTLGNEVRIMIRKLLSSPADSAKKIGMLGGLAMIRSFASEQNEDIEHDVTSGFAASQGEAMNSANRTEIYTLLHLLISSCSVSSPYCYSFLCDELVEIVREGLLDCKVVDELKTLAENELTEKFLVPEGEELSDVLISNPKSLWFDLNDQVNNIAVMLYYMIKEEKANLLIKLAPLLRLLKVSRVFLDEPLEGIDALVGCPLFLISPDDFEDFTRLGAVMQSNVGLALFFGLCWCRELINSFYSSSDITIKHKVVKRVEHLREMEQMLQRCLSQEPRVLLSITKFISTIEDIPPLTIDKQLLKKDTGGSSSSKDQMEDFVPKDDDEIGENEPLQNAKPRLLVTPHVDFLRPFIRELELGSCLILAYSAISPDSESFSESTSALDEAIELEPSVLHYLLQDLNNKLTVLLSPPKRTTYFGTTSSKSNSLKQEHRLLTSQWRDPLAAVRFLRPAFPALCDHLQRVGQVCEVLQQASRARPYLGACLTLIFKCFERLFCFEEIYKPENLPLAKEVMSSIRDRWRRQQQQQQGGEDASSSSLSALLRACFIYFSNFSQVLTDLDTGVALVNLLVAIVRREASGGVAEGDLSERLSQLCAKLLNTEWKEQKLKADSLVFLLEHHIRLAPQPTAVISNFVLNVLPKVITKQRRSTSSSKKSRTYDDDDERREREETEEEEDEEEDSNNFKTLTQQTFLVYFKVLLRELVCAFSSIKTSGSGSGAAESTTTTTDVSEVLNNINQCVLVYRGLITLAKETESSPVLAEALRKGRTFVETFIKLMPFLSKHFFNNREDIQLIIKNLQTSTRAMQVLCAHGKTEQVVTLVNLVPPVKKSLESLIYKVKVMLIDNDCLNAFWMGNLKHRNLRGQEVNSQVAEGDSQYESTGSSQEEDEEKSKEEEEEEED